MRVSRSESVENYAKFIQEVYELTHKAPVRVPLHALARKHRISQMVSTALQQEGSLRRGKLNTYRWMGPAPTPTYTAGIRNSVMVYHKENSQKHKAERMKDQVKMDLAPETAVTPTVTRAKYKRKKNISLFWGLIKFSY